MERTISLVCSGRLLASHPELALLPHACCSTGCRRATARTERLSSHACLVVVEKETASGTTSDDLATAPFCKARRAPRRRVWPRMARWTLRGWEPRAISSCSWRRQAERTARLLPTLRPPVLWWLLGPLPRKSLESGRPSSHLRRLLSEGGRFREEMLGLCLGVALIT